MLHGPGPWQPAAMTRAARRAGHNISFGRMAPEDDLHLAAGPPALQLLVLPDRPAHDPELATSTWDREAGAWTVSHRALADLRRVLAERSRARCRAGILAAAPEEDQRNAALGLLSATAEAAIKKAIGNWRAAHAAHSAAIEALGTANAVAGYDLTKGWPE
ncbi:MAG: hypothetical protein RIB82_15960 [Sneathiellaceae bacterium]